MHTAIYSIYNPSGPPATEQGSTVHHVEEYSMINQPMNRATSQNCFHNKTKENAFEWMQLKAKSVPLPPIIIPLFSWHTSCDVSMFQRYGADFIKELSVTNQEICGQSVKALLGQQFTLPHLSEWIPSSFQGFQIFWAHSEWIPSSFQAQAKSWGCLFLLRMNSESKLIPSTISLM